MEKDKSLKENTVTSQTNLDFNRLLSDIKQCLIYVHGGNTEAKRRVLFKEFTGYEGKIKDVPDAILEKLYFDLKDQIATTKMYLSVAPIINDIKQNDGRTTEYLLIENNKYLEIVVQHLSNKQTLAIDTETTGLNPRKNKLRLIQIACEDYPTVIIDCFKCDAKLIQPLLKNLSFKIFHNAKFDLQFFLALGLEINQSLFDTMLAHQLIIGNRHNASLKDVCKKYLNIELNKDEQKSDWGKTLTKTQLEYAVKDAEILLDLRTILRQQLIDFNLTTIAKIEFDCVLTVAMMEFNGIKLNHHKWEQILKDSKERQCFLETEIKKVLIMPTQQMTLFDTPEPLNLNSHEQLTIALNYYGIPILKTGEEDLLPYKEDLIINLLLEYKKLTKFITSFGLSILDAVEEDGRIHGSYWQLGASSGRMSESNPNLQQIPRKKELRECFIPEDNYKYIIADYSQIELRIAAEYTNDLTMLNAYKKGEDLHKLTASIVLNKPLNEINKEDRQIAKSANFGLLYGASVNGFKSYAENNYGIKLIDNEAQKIINNFFNSYQGLNKWHIKIQNGIKQGKIKETRTLGKRRKLFDEPTPQTALNTPIQGTGADILKLALSKLPVALKDFNCKIIHCVHDEIIVEAHESVADKVKEILEKEMIKAGQYFLKQIPVEADANIVNNWAEK